MSLQDDLRRALQREPAPPDFADRVLERARRPRPFPLALAAALAALAVIPAGIYEYREYQKAIEARDQLVAALSITRDTLQHVQQQIQHHTRHVQ